MYSLYQPWHYSAEENCRYNTNTGIEKIKQLVETDELPCISSKERNEYFHNQAPYQDCSLQDAVQHHAGIVEDMAINFL